MFHLIQRKYLDLEIAPAKCISAPHYFSVNRTKTNKGIQVILVYFRMCQGIRMHKLLCCPSNYLGSQGHLII